MTMSLLLPGAPWRIAAERQVNAGLRLHHRRLRYADGSMSEDRKRTSPQGEDAAKVA